MNADTKEHAAETDASEAQFGLRALLGAMTLVAVFAGVAGFAIRRFPAESRTLAMAAWGSLFGAVVVYFAWGLWRRKWAEKHAGPVLLQVDVKNDSSSVYWIGWRLIVGLTLFTFVWLITFDTLSDVFSANGRGGLLSMAFPAVFYLSWLQQMIEYYWNRRLRICERGIVWGCNLLPWNNVLEYRWTGFDSGRLELRGINDSRKQPWASVPIPAKFRASVGELLEAKLADVLGLPASGRWVGIGEASISLVMRTALYRRHLVFVTINVIMSAILFYWGIIRGTGAREFRDAIYSLPIVALFVAPLIRQQFVKRSDVPIARVFARRDLIGFLTNVSIATGIYWLSASTVLRPDWLGYLAGIAFVYFLVKTASYYFLTQLDFRTDGLVILWAFFWPWESITLHHWDPEESGRLVLGRKWRRVTAFVPQEQRETVDRVLREKFGMPRETTQPRKEAVGEVVA